MIGIGSKIRIVDMTDEPLYNGREGTVTVIDSIGQIHGTWGGLALIPGIDSFHEIKEDNNGTSESSC